MLTSVAEQDKWAARWLQSESLSYSERLVTFVLAKSIFFHSGYAVIEWFKKKGRMPGLSSLINLLGEDGALHSEFACLLLKGQEDLPEVDFVHTMVAEAVGVEVGFIRGKSHPIAAVIVLIIFLRCLVIPFLP